MPACLRRVHQSVHQENLLGTFRRIVIVQRDNVLVHTSQIAMGDADQFGLEVLPHPSCSPDLVLIDYHLFPRQKIHLRKKGTAMIMNVCMLFRFFSKI